MSGEIRVAVVDRHEVLSRGVVACLRDDGALEVTEAAPQDVSAQDFDIAVVSCELAAKHRFDCPIVVCVDDPAGPHGVAAGNEVSGILHRGSMTAAQLHATVRAAAAGLRVNPQAAASPREGLDPRAVRVLELIADGHSTREIADALSYSERTIKKLITRLEATMDARSRAQVVALAIRRGLI